MALAPESVTLFLNNNCVHLFSPFFFPFVFSIQTLSVLISLDLGECDNSQYHFLHLLYSISTLLTTLGLCNLQSDVGLFQHHLSCDRLMKFFFPTPFPVAALRPTKVGFCQNCQIASPSLPSIMSAPERKMMSLFLSEIYSSVCEGVKWWVYNHGEVRHLVDY